MKNLLITVISLMIFCSTNCMAQYKVGDYYVNGDIKGIVFFVNNDEGVVYLLKTDMQTRYEDINIGDKIEWRDKSWVEEYANRPYPYTAWDIPNARMARLINQNAEILNQACIDQGFNRLPLQCFMNGRIGYDSVGQRLIPFFWTRNVHGDDAICQGDRGNSEGLLLRPLPMGILLYGIVNYRTGALQRLD